LQRKSSKFAVPVKKIYVLLFAIISYSSAFSQIQTTVTFKPGPDIGRDAYIMTMWDCLPHGHTTPIADQNNGNYPDIRMLTWTFNAVGCPEGITRSLLQFDELSTIPANAVIINAELKLYGVSNGTTTSQGNSCYLGSPYDCPNKIFIQRITSPWDEQTVTWNTQPTATTVNQITIPQSTSQWNWNFTDNSNNLVAMVQDMVTHPATNFGFMLKLETEAYYRSMFFASSDHSNPALWPELTVTYEYCSPEIIVIYDTVIVYDTIAIRDTVYVQNPRPCDEEGSIIKVYPSPTISGWTVEIIAEKEESIRIQLSDMTGKIIYSDNKMLVKGENSFVINASNLATGAYNLRIRGKTIFFSQTLLKK